MKGLLEQDRRLFFWIFNASSSIGMRRILFVSKTGDGYLYLLIAALLWFYDPVHGELFIYVGLLAYAFELPLFLLLKKWLKRPRPADLLSDFNAHIKPADKFSLPSGHTAAAFLMATILSYFYPPIAGLAILWAGLIGLSRVLLGVHYPSDILAGAVLGTSVGLFSLLVMA
ncbi:phosphatase PAP2 family protein [Alteromonas flava]|uniref:phosphatase PAP2 family protein n=1 Tax=Alteromonas flava TaxID=2048003 RepID=UPI000C28A1D0|nr:phosphatase PAP2 family protein [Alteromonas flava]